MSNVSNDCRPLELKLRVLADHIKRNNGLRDNAAQDHRMLIKAADALAAQPSPLAEQDKVDAEPDMASPDYQAGWNAAMDAMTKAMTRVETLDAIRAARAKKEPQ